MADIRRSRKPVPYTKEGQPRWVREALAAAVTTLSARSHLLQHGAGSMPGEILVSLLLEVGERDRPRKERTLAQERERRLVVAQLDALFGAIERARVLANSIKPEVAARTDVPLDALDIEHRLTEVAADVRFARWAYGAHLTLQLGDWRDAVISLRRNTPLTWEAIAVLTFAIQDSRGAMKDWEFTFVEKDTAVDEANNLKEAYATRRAQLAAGEAAATDVSVAPRGGRTRRTS